MQLVDLARSHPLYDVAATRRIEQRALATLPPHALMQRAGRSVARLALALAPHAQTVWLVCGPGNNGGDGLEAAACLRAAGKNAVVTWLGDEARLPDDARASLARARAHGVVFSYTPPALGADDIAVDALLGIGQRRAPHGRLADSIAALNALHVPVLAVDLPSGLDADTGAVAGLCVRATQTLSLVTLKPGLFTAQGRDAAGMVWLDSLDCDLSYEPARAALAGAPPARQRLHASHKGSYGDVAVLGGASGMQGAALLAATAALHGGAGRVYVALLAPLENAVAAHPELMFGTPHSLDWSRATAVCGCGGADAIANALPPVLAAAPRLVLDADALNALAQDANLRALLQARGARGQASVLTPHPLEAARLLNASTADVQTDRLAAAQRLADELACVVVLKGSGSVIAAPAHPPAINPSGNALLATAGTGDVLAGLVGARLAAGLPAFDAACDAVWTHGDAADRWPAGTALTAAALAQALR